MRRPVVRRDLVADQIVHRLGVGNAQQRLGQAHQRHAFLGRQAVGREEHLHQPRIGRPAHRLDQIRRPRRHGLPVAGRQRNGAEQPGKRLVLVGQVAARISWRI